MPFKFNPFTGNLDLVEVSSSPTGDVAFIAGNSGGDVPPNGSGVINLLGNNSQGINITGNVGANTLTVAGINSTESQIGVVELASAAETIAGASSTLAVHPSGLNSKLGSQTQFGLIIGGGSSSALGVTNIGTNGQVVIGATGGNPAFGTLTSPDSSITFTTGANTLALSVSGGSSVGKTITGDTGGSLSPSAGNWNLFGSGSITTSGSGNTLTTQLTGLTNHSVLVGAGTTTITKVAPSSTSGVPFISQGASSDPTFGTAVVAGGGTGVTSFTAYAVICGGTTATGALQSIASVGTAGHVLTSNGAGALPTFQAASTANGVVQQTRASTVTASSNSTTIPFDDTVPTSSEGTEILTCAITPTSSSHILVIEAVVVGTIAAGTIGSICLFQDSGSNAIAVTTFSTVSSELWETWRMTYYMTAGTTSSTTFKIRVGANSGNFCVNSNSTGRKFGGALFTMMSVTEYVA